MEPFRILILTTFLLVPLAIAQQTSVVDFCVADFNFPVTPAGYPCKNPENLSADDFVFTGFRNPGPFDSLFNVSVNLAFHDAFPALNGLGLSMARIDIGVGGAVRVHSHRVSETIVMIEGTIIAGFIAPDVNNNTAFFKILKKGDVMIFPHSLLHFQVNIGSTTALAFVSLNSANPGFQSLSNSLFGNDLPADIVRRITLIDVEEVNELKRVFGGTN